jgi:steroid delta-isomerase-like uncharacterized protein
MQKRMKKVWKALKGGSPARNGYSKKENPNHRPAGAVGTAGPESFTGGTGPPSLQDGTIYTSVRQQQQDNLQQQMTETPVPPPRSNLPMRNGGGGAQPQHHQQDAMFQQQQQQQQVVYVNEQGHRVTATTVRVPPPVHLAPYSSPAAAAAAQQQPPPMVGGGPVPHPPHAVRQLPAAESSPLPLPVPDPIQVANETTRSLVKKFIADIWNRGEIDLIPDVCSPNLRFNGNTGFDRIGHDGLARMVATIRDALDEYHCEIHSMVVENNKAFCRLRFTGKHTGPLLGYPPTGKVVAWMGATEFTCQGGKILKVWELGDVKSLEEQLQPSGTDPVEEDEI